MKTKILALGVLTAVVIGLPTTMYAPPTVVGPPPPPYVGEPLIAAGGGHTLAVASSGAVLATGNNSNGQLGTGSTTDNASFIATSLTQAISIDGGDVHTLAVKADGTVWAWGGNGNGRLGDGTSTQRLTPVQVLNLTNMMAVAAGGSHSLALSSNGTVWAWGLGTSGQLGNGTNLSRTTPVQVTGLNNIVAIAAGDTHSLALAANGTVWAWGNNGSGRLGDPTPGNRSSPVAVGNFNNIIAIAAGGSHSMALDASGQVWAWGYNISGQLGNNTTISSTNAVAATNLSGVVKIAAGNSHSVALLADGTVRTWGANASGQLGNASLVNQKMPVTVLGLNGVRAIAAGDLHSAAMLTNGTVVAWGDLALGQLGNGEFNYRPVAGPVDVVTNAVGIAAGSLHNTARLADNSVVAWGNNANGQLGNGGTADTATFANVGGLTNVVALENGDLHSLALKSDGTIWAWGYNGNGRLGDGTTTQRLTPVRVTNLTEVAAVAAGGGFSLALKTNGTVWAWGLGTSGQLGNGANLSQTTRVQVSGLNNIVAIAAGDTHAMALDSTGTVWAWGNNANGRVGDGTTVNRSTPVAVANLSGIIAIAAGGSHSMALDSSGQVWCWGLNTSGQFGNNSSATSSSTPVQAINLSGAVKIAAGNAHSLALLANGTVRAWGGNTRGQLGIGTLVNQKTNVTVLGVSGVAAIAAGDIHSVAVLTNGTVLAWGDTDNGQLGDGNAGYYSTVVSLHTYLLPTAIITSQPVDTTVAHGSTATFTVGAFGSVSSVSYQWYRVVGFGFNETQQVIAGATNATLALTNVQAGITCAVGVAWDTNCNCMVPVFTNCWPVSYPYFVIVSSPFDSVTSVRAVLNVIAPPNLTSQPQSLTRLQGQTAVLSVGAETTVAGQTPLTYQWFFNGGALPGATSTNLTLANVTSAEAGSYYARVTGGIASTQSVTASLTVIVPPTITTQPVGGTNCSGETTTLTATVAGTAPIHCEWFYGTNALAESNTNRLELANLTTNDTGSYFLIVTNAAGATTSSVVTLTVRSPWECDINNNGLPDGWELKYFGNLNQPANGDFDDDDLTNLQEYQLGTTPAGADTDGDGLTDAQELLIPIDTSHPEWGHLNPLKAQSGRKPVSDGDLDSDHDGLSNFAEVSHYLSDPANAHTYSTGLKDSEYFHLGFAHLVSTAGLPAAYTPMARFEQLTPVNGRIQFTISETFPGSRYDVYFVNNVASARWQWRRVYSEAICDANGTATFSIAQPDPVQGYFLILDAHDSDGDGLTDGYESWFTYNGEISELNLRDTDFDQMNDGWEVTYGLNPTTTGAAADGGAADPDEDGYTNKEEHDFSSGIPSWEASFDPLRIVNTGANRPVVTIFPSTVNSGCAVASFTIYRQVGADGNYNNPLTVYYSVGGNLTYGTDYTLSPAPIGLPRIFSAVIPAGEASVTITATLIGNAVSSGVKTLYATVTPYGVSPVSQVSDRQNWTYVVDWNYNRAAMPFDFENLRPYAIPQNLTVCPNAATTITLNGYDYCGDALTYTVLTSPQHGMLTPTASDQIYIYQPDQNYLGADSFTFKVNDGVRDSEVATVTLNVDNQPTANPQTVPTFCRDTVMPITLTGSGGCDQPLTYILVNQPAHGWLTGTAPDYLDLVYHPNAGYEGPDSFTFKVSNGLQESAPATVSLEVGYVPAANSKTYLTHLGRNLDITLTASDPCNDPLTYTVVRAPNPGSLTGTAPTVVYHPVAVGGDDFDFTASDGLRSGGATIHITVLPKPAVVANCRPNSILIDWTLLDNPFVLGAEFKVYRSTTSGAAYSGGNVIGTVTFNDRTFTDANVTPGTTYYYAVSLRYHDPGTDEDAEAVSSEVSSSTCCPTDFWTDDGVTAQQLAEWISAPGDTVVNATFTGAPKARGIFGQGLTTGLPIDSGVILSTGIIGDAKGPNDVGNKTSINGFGADADLNNLIAGSSEDAAVLEFDVITQSGTLSFDYIFASEEYLEWVYLTKNDTFAIFVNGENIAWAPGTSDQTIAVDNIHSGLRPEYFTHNENPPVFNLQYDGFTTAEGHPYLSASVNVSPGTPHHIKIVIADVGDPFWDSAVFIKAKRLLPCP